MCAGSPSPTPPQAIPLNAPANTPLTPPTAFPASASPATDALAQNAVGGADALNWANEMSIVNDAMSAYGNVNKALTTNTGIQVPNQPKLVPFPQQYSF
jgi:hypothetical protein